MSNPLLVGVVIGAFFPGPLGPVPVVTTGHQLGLALATQAPMQLPVPAMNQTLLRCAT